MSNVLIVKHLLSIAALLTTNAFAQVPERPPIVQEQRGNVTNVRVEGSLAAAQDLACISLSEAKPSFTPPDLHTAIAKCMSKSEFAKAAQLFMLAATYAQFDAERISDKTARGGVQVLMMKTFSGFSKEQKEEFSRAFNQLAQDPSELQATCSEMSRIGPPTYFPRYLILHGMNAFTSSSPLDNALDPHFDAAGTWSRLQDTYARCPK